MAAVVTPAKPESDNSAPSLGPLSEENPPRQSSYGENMSNSDDPAEGHATPPDEAKGPLHEGVHCNDTLNEQKNGETIVYEYSLPRCIPPPSKEYQKMEIFVETAVSKHHEQIIQSKARNGQRDSVLPVKNYLGIIDTLHSQRVITSQNGVSNQTQTDQNLLLMLLSALRTAGNGKTLQLLTSSLTKHARLIHAVFQLNAFPSTITNDAAVKTPACESASKDNHDSPSLLHEDRYHVADAQFNLILALVSANAGFVVPAMTGLWKLLMAQHDHQQELLSMQQDQTGDEVVNSLLLERTRRIHATLASIMRLCPKARTELFGVMSANVPFRTRPESQLVWYYQQCLEVLQYHPSILEQVLELVIDKCLDLDVEIKISDFGEVSLDPKKEDEDDNDGIFELELDEKKKPDTSVTPASVTVGEMANKLDSLMLLLFQYSAHFVKKHSKSQGNPAEAVKELYSVYIRVFESSILVCHKSKFVQYLILYICGLEAKLKSSYAHASQADDDSSLYRDFAARLIEIVLDPYRSTVTRQSGACYLASFVSRANFVCPETVCEAVSALLRWAEAYIESLHSTNIHAADARGQCALHSLFYTVCQAAFYIMCFRGAEACRFFQVIADADGVEHVDISSNRWNKICSHRTTPLRFCLETVRTEFLDLAKLYELVDGSILEKLSYDEDHTSKIGKPRKRVVTAIKTAATLEKERLRGGVGGLGRGTNPLDSFFPFDPYLLRRSHVFVEPFYIHWTGSSEDNVQSDDHEDYSNHEVLSDGEVSDADLDIDGEGEGNSDGSGSSSDEDSEDDGFEPMSLASNAGLGIETAVSPGPVVRRATETPHSAWSETLKRARAPSIENGSW